jgi:hypothetical protein
MYVGRSAAASRGRRGKPDGNRRAFFEWYNREHCHSGIGMLTPFDLYHGLAESPRDARAAVMMEAWAKHPERFPHGRPVPPALPTAAWTNKPASAAAPAEPPAGGVVALPVNAAAQAGFTIPGGAH